MSNIIHHDSPEALHKSLSSFGAKRTIADFERSSYASATNQLDKLATGDTSYIEQARKLIEDMTNHSLLSTGLKMYEPSIVGAFPHVPNYLNDLPETMYQLDETDLRGNTTPIRIFMQLNSSAGVSSAELTSRGLTALGLVLALESIRPIDLYVVGVCRIDSSLENFGTCTRVETRPLDLARAAYMLCCPEFYRVITWAASVELGRALGHQYTGINFAFGESPGSRASIDAYTKALSLNNDDVFLPGTFLINSQYKNDPIGYIKNYLKKYE